MNFRGFEQLLILWVIFYLIIAIVHIGFAVGVYNDAENLLKETGRKPFFVNSIIWTLATLIGGVFAAGIYWAIHHSTLNPYKNNDQKQDNI
jgi:hypothetical protein